MLDSAFEKDLGVALDSISEDKVRIKLPFKDQNSNPGGVLHGGVAASMIDISGLALASSVLGESMGPFHTASINVQYLAAAINEPIIAEGTLLRRGKELAFIDVRVATEEGKAISQGTVVVRGRSGATDFPKYQTVKDSGASEPGPMGEHLPKRVPFIGHLGLHVENMSGGEARIVMPFLDHHADSAGGVHEGAILAHLDTTGAMAAWAETGPGAYKASTVQLSAQMVAPASPEDLIAYGILKARDKEIFWCDVEVASKSDGHVVARGSEVYRIVIPA